MSWPQVHSTHAKLWLESEMASVKIQIWTMICFACPSHVNVVSYEAAGVVCGHVGCHFLSHWHLILRPKTALCISPAFAAHTNVIEFSVLFNLTSIKKKMWLVFGQLTASFIQSSVMSCFLRCHRCFLVSSWNGGWERWINGRVYAFDPSSCT